MKSACISFHNSVNGLSSPVGGVMGLMETWDPEYRGIVAERTTLSLLGWFLLPRLLTLVPKKKKLPKAFLCI